MTHEIVQNGNAVLRQIAREVPREDITSKLIQDYIASMKEAMYAAPGVGLAAPQIGISLQIIVIHDREQYFETMLPHIQEERGRKAVPFHVLINPKLSFVSKEQAVFFEGCLSVKNYMRITPRAEHVRVEYLDEQGNERSIDAHGWYARILQHEIDHLHGKLYIDIGDKKTELMINDENKKKWLNATAQEIQHYLQATLKT